MLPFLLTKQDMCTIYKSWICPTLEYGSILYSGAASTHLHRLDDLQSWIEWSCSFVFQPPSHHRNAAIMGLVCHLLAGEGHENLQTEWPQFCGNQTHRRSHHPYSCDPGEYLHFVNPCNFRTLDIFKRSWLATAADIWNGLPANVILQGEASGWHTTYIERCAVLYVTGFRKICIIHTSNFSTLVTHKMNLKWWIHLKFLGIAEPVILYHP